MRLVGLETIEISVSVLIQKIFFLDSATLAGTGNTFADFFNWFVDPVASLFYITRRAVATHARRWTSSCRRLLMYVLNLRGKLYFRR